MTSKKKKDEPENDPYDVLGVEFGSSDSAITKAYRKLALKLHPDRRAGLKLSPLEAEQADKEFHKVQQARDFLLEAEFQEARRKYDAKRESIQRRRQADAKRQQSMNQSKKRQLDALYEAEQEALRNKNNKKKKDKGSSKTGGSRSREEDELISKLKDEGMKMRVRAAERKAQEDADDAVRQARNEKQDRKQKERVLQNRQVRLKWSRRKMETSPSEHSLANLLSRFGTVETVEMIGSKGNMAQITFEFPSSCRPCVDFYKTSEEMRAFFVGKRKEEEEAREAAADHEEQDMFVDRANQARNQESLEDRKLRQAAERERLLREMEAEDEAEEKATTKTQEGARGSSMDVSSRCVSVSLPSKYKHLTPMEALVKAEEDILGKILSGDSLARLQELHA